MLFNKKIIGLCLFLMTFSYQLHAQLAVGVSPGFSLNSAQIGYKINKVVPYVSYQYYRASFKTTTETKEYNADLQEIVDVTFEDKLSANLHLPTIGVKYFFKEKDKLKAYVNLNVTKPIASLKYTEDGKEDEEIQDEIKNLKLWGGQLGLGVEYFLDEHFSFGAEYGLRYFSIKNESSSDSEVYNQDTSEYEEFEKTTNWKTVFTPTYSKIALNYYF